jgi:hypothetical protein
LGFIKGEFLFLATDLTGGDGYYYSLIQGYVKKAEYAIANSTNYRTRSDMNNHYTESWLLYKLHSESFVDDQQYYLDFTRNYSTLELFSGYGRLTNYLFKNGVDIESIELEKNFTNFISLPDEKNHIGNVLNFNPEKKFERVIAGYNSFCLLTREEDIHNFFINLSGWLAPGGMASLSYYHPDFWLKHSGFESHFEHDGQLITHVSRPDLSNRHKKHGIWVDEYIQNGRTVSFSYPTTIYETSDCIIPYLNGTDLRLVNTVIDYNMADISDNGWVEFVFERSAQLQK